MTPEKQMRTLHPFLSLCFKTIPHKMRASDFNWRAEPCLHLRYDPNKKSFMLLSLPDLHLTDSVEIKHVGMTFPLRATHYRTRQLDEFLRPAEDQSVYGNMHGPRNIMRRHWPAPQATTHYRGTGAVNTCAGAHARRARRHAHKGLHTLQARP